MQTLDKAIYIDKDPAKGASKPSPSSRSAASSQTKSNRVKQSSQYAKNKKAKRLPWNSDVLTDRFTPQSYPVQILDACTAFNNFNSHDSKSAPNMIVLMKNNEWKSYYKIMTIKQYSLNSNSKIILLVTDLSSDVSKYVELVSRHTTLKIAGIDHLANIQFDETYCNMLKTEAQIIITSIEIAFECFKRGYLTEGELNLVIIDEACAALLNDSYRLLVKTYFNNQLARIVSFGTLSITSATTYAHIKKQLEYLKVVFNASYIETATDLICTHNLLYGIEPLETIQMYANGNKDQSGSYQTRLLGLIKQYYAFLDSVASEIGHGKQVISFFFLSKLYEIVILRQI
jgi:hypothetical protein